MFIYSISILTIILALTPIAFLFFSKKCSKINFILYTFILLFVFFCGGWIYVSIYFKFVIIILFIPGTLYYFKKSISDNNKFTFWNYLWKIPLLILLFVFIYLYYISRIYDSESVDIAFPFRDGKYCIMQGGSNKFVNIFHNINPHSVFAYDIVKINTNGNRAKTFFPQEAVDFEVYGKKIYSPSDGIIVAMSNKVTDNIPPEVNMKEKAGNYVVIQRDSIFIMLAHLKQNSVMVKQFDSVKAGDLIGEAGNSGNSIEPHLHIEARETKNGVTVPLSIKFENRFYTYNDVINK